MEPCLPGNLATSRSAPLCCNPVTRRSRRSQPPPPGGDPVRRRTARATRSSGRAFLQARAGPSKSMRGGT
eukprot:5266362-Alexandrium_andersonii.AAC.1